MTQIQMLSPIREFTNLFNAKECQDILDCRIAESTVNGKLTDYVVFNDTVDIEWQKKLKNIHLKTMPLLKTYVEDFLNLMPFDRFEISHIGFLNDKDGSFTELHYDWEMMIYKKKVIPKPFVMLIYLNDVAEGGELYFPLQNVKVKPKQGNAVLFPCHYSFPHLSTPVTNGSKHVCRVTFKVQPEAYELEVLEI